MGDSAGRVVVIAPSERDAAFAALRAGAVVVVAGADAAAVGAAVAEWGRVGGRVAGYVGEAGDAALAELVAELFRGR